MGGISEYGGNFIFDYAYPISFIGGIMFSLISLFGFEISNIITNKTATILLNTIIGISGLVSLSYWYNYEVPILGGIINDVITTKGNKNPPKIKI